MEHKMLDTIQCDPELRIALEEAEASESLKVVIYSPTLWSVERIDGSKALNFNPQGITNHIRGRIHLAVRQDVF